MNKNEKAVKAFAIIGVIFGSIGVIVSLSITSLYGYFIGGAFLLIWGVLDLKFISSKKKNLIPAIKLFAIIGIIIGVGSFFVLLFQGALTVSSLLASLYWSFWGIYDFRILSPKSLFDKKIF